MDRERVAVAKAYGVNTPDVFKWLEDVCDRRDKAWPTGCKQTLRRTTVIHQHQTHLLSGDVPYTLVPISSLGEVVIEVIT